MALGRLDVGRIALCRYLTEEPQGVRFVTTFTLLPGEFQSFFSIALCLCTITTEQCCLTELRDNTRTEQSGRAPSPVQANQAIVEYRA